MRSLTLPYEAGETGDRCGGEILLVFTGDIAPKYRLLAKSRANILVIKIQVMFSTSRKGRTQQ
jgi:hypothetical protein